MFQLSFYYEDRPQSMKKTDAKLFIIATIDIFTLIKHCFNTRNSIIHEAMNPCSCTKKKELTTLGIIYGPLGFSFLLYEMMCLMKSPESTSKVKLRSNP